MKLIWNSSTPLGNSGYGGITRELVPRLIKAGHEVKIAIKHWHYGWHDWQGVEVFEGLHLDYMSNIIEREGFDYIISCWDIWGLHSKRHFPKDKWVAYVPIDTEWIAQRYKEVLLGTDMQQDGRGPGSFIAMSKHGSRELESIGIKSVYAPVGVDTNIFKPDSEGRAKHREAMEVDDSNFVVGSVGLNYGDDRKGFVQLLVAFKEFVEQHPEARLYLHTHADGRHQNTLNYVAISNYLGLHDHVIFANQEYIDMDRVTPEQLNAIYNGMDVFCLPTKGEGFGMTMVEAAACGIPVITTATTTGPEFHEAGIAPWLIDVSSIDNKYWLPTDTMRLEPKPTEILKCFEAAYNAWKYSDYGVLKDQAHDAALAYDWDVIFSRFWAPILKMLEGKKNDNS